MGLSIATSCGDKLKNGGNECVLLIVSKVVQVFVVEIHVEVKRADVVVNRGVPNDFVCSFVPVNLYEVV